MPAPSPPLMSRPTSTAQGHDPLPSARRALLRDVRCLGRRHGLKGFLRRIPRSLLTALYTSVDELVLVKTLDGLPDGDGDDGNVRVEPLGPHHAGALAALNRERCATRKDRRFAERLAKGHQCFMLYSRDEVAGYFWWVDKQIDAAHPEVVHLGIELEEQDVYTFDYYLAEGHRGQGTALAGFRQIERALKCLGYRRLWGYVLEDNRPARWIYRILGYEVRWQVTRRGGLLAPAQPWWHALRSRVRGR